MFIETVRACLTREYYDKERNIRFLVCRGRCRGASRHKANKIERTIIRFFLDVKRDNDQNLIPFVTGSYLDI